MTDIGHQSGRCMGDRRPAFASRYLVVVPLTVNEIRIEMILNLDTDAEKRKLPVQNCHP
ncbi:hypothetical protein [Burkholderia sp. Bp8984]|uniref:hypothetical protein n=1 Tax=Burkholderia sp. Bp8984 TaxID=2184549 RepID=UPI001628482C|nr:hypothetical protein [Burkholderia sp. Bp8984]